MPFSPTISVVPARLVLLASSFVIAAAITVEAKASDLAARVNGEKITIDQINLLIESQPDLKPEQRDSARRQALEGLIDQQLVMVKAKKQKLDRDPAVIQKLDAFRRQLMTRAYIERAAAEMVDTPTTEDIREFFYSKPALFSQRKVYQLKEFTLAAKADEAKDLIERLDASDSPQAFVELIRNSGLKVSTNQVTQAAEELPMVVLDKLKDVPDGKAMYITGTAGFKAIFVERSELMPITFEQAQPAIKQYLITERRREFIQKEIKNLRATAKIEYIGAFAEKPAEAASTGLDANALSKGLSGLK